MKTGLVKVKDINLEDIKVSFWRKTIKELQESGQGDVKVNIIDDYNMIVDVF